jgi:hypothetical protein
MRMMRSLSRCFLPQCSASSCRLVKVMLASVMCSSIVRPGHSSEPACERSYTAASAIRSDVPHGSELSRNTPAVKRVCWTREPASLDSHPDLLVAAPATSGGRYEDLNQLVTSQLMSCGALGQQFTDSRPRPSSSEHLDHHGEPQYALSTLLREQYDAAQAASAGSLARSMRQ